MYSLNRLIYYYYFLLIARFHEAIICKCYILIVSICFIQVLQA